MPIFTVLPLEGRYLKEILIHCPVADLKYFIKANIRVNQKQEIKSNETTCLKNYIFLKVIKST